MNSLSERTARVRIGGSVICRQRPRTAKRFAFPLATKTFNGTTLYVVGLDVGSRVNKRVFTNLHDAEAQRRVWEAQVRHRIALHRIHSTSLSAHQVRECEIAHRLLKNTGLRLLEAVLIGIRQTRKE